MEKNGNKVKESDNEKTLRRILHNQRIANSAVRNAQEENRRLGLPNWYSINGKIVNEAELTHKETLKK
jgi:hypothetical protein